MTTPWPDDSTEALLGDVFERALRPTERSYVLFVPAAIMDQSPETIKAWLDEHHPGYPVMVAPEPPASIEAWVGQFGGKADAWRKVRDLLA
jgi:hypothetical protein